MELQTNIIYYIAFRIGDVRKIIEIAMTPTKAANHDHCDHVSRCVLVYFLLVYAKFLA